ncbi:unnamed protein product, partial [Ilex paraguariensis]
IIEIRGDQVTSKQCLTVRAKLVAKSQQVFIADEELPLLEDVGDKPKDKSIEELQVIPVDQTHPDRYFLIRSQLPTPEKESLIGLLRRNIEIFSWTP